MRRHGPLSLCLAAAAFLGCSPAGPAHAPRGGSSPLGRCGPPSPGGLQAFLRAARPRYTGAIAGARAFLDALEVDPRELRAHGIKGKKKLVEALDAYSMLYRIAAPADRPALLARVAQLARPTADDRYHDMLSIDDVAFHEDATSYLRAALLLDQLGLDTRRYRAEIAAVKARLDQHMGTRGPHQRRAFHHYYQHFGLAEPFPLESALGEGLIAARVAADTLSRPDVYAFTHEVYAAHDFGDALDESPFAEPDRAYLRATLPRLLEVWLARKDTDLTAELSTCMSYLGLDGEPVHVEALRALLDAQNADGSWGRYESARARLGEWVRQGLYLHTTMVALEALALAFDDALPRGGALRCR